MSDATEWRRRFEEQRDRAQKAEAELASGSAYWRHRAEELEIQYGTVRTELAECREQLRVADEVLADAFEQIGRLKTDSLELERLRAGIWETRKAYGSKTAIFGYLSRLLEPEP